ncbi:DNA mismatch repair protein MutS [Flavilitoribacter nigricans]|uniref:DNA mismatch repair protein MutS n=1 Tax=Flavilitoribacter nigricans (strain ATCC 23147 / DSM 23189 / NBRC 102662 / NCIMB 1420 / SS-2) TaxID=1122177 RepID=A0A2D0NBU4_FLAN2|nr:DNA mismatch repair protein MutS [Flavilitoribacter nigricans]PHN05649.1 DNA mismatch repair protein MutS [Flavilitoribacter nigricans DSM 23189 = NBRC 102662]
MARKSGTKKAPKKVTPLMQQYFKVKNKYPDAILLFRVGDFYETFGEDAVKASQVLGIVLTSRNNGGSDIELAGFPHHSMDLYLPRLVKAGFRVAICEQLEKPSPQKKIVKRGVTEVVTPGIAMDDKLLDHKQNNYLAAVTFGRNDLYGLAFLDISTGEFLVCEGTREYADKLLQSFKPAEVLYSKDRKKAFEQQFGDKFYSFHLDEWIFTEDYAREKLLEQFAVTSLKGFGVEDLALAQIAAGSVLHYLATTENKNIKHISAIGRIQAGRYVWLDRFTIRNLELIYSPHDTGVPLINILDQTVTSMGARLLKKWVVLPLKNRAEVEARHDIVDYFLIHTDLDRELTDQLKQMGDLERLIAKVPMGKINPREVVQLKRALSVLVPIRESLGATGNDDLVKIAEGIKPCPDLKEKIAQAIIEDPPVNLSKGGVIADGYHEELDELRNIIQNSKDILLDIQQREVERTGINSLKIGFNNVFGYYLEVTNKYKNQVPPEWTRKQTLTNGERYITDELKKLEAKILGAEERSLELEEKLYEELVIFLLDYIRPVQHNAALMARIDCLLSFAKVARKNQYHRPTMDDSLAIDIQAGRHPVIEQMMPIGESYVPNDVFLDNEEQQILMITGPNMAGKSALLRQTALISLMAQMGSFVPAASARLGMVDKVFTRVGASDNISSGESTFMVEMNETASIMNNISDRSLILLDEIGRGTSTYDGISIAWSIAEFLHNNGECRPKTLFATHYHELNELANKFPRIRNFHIATREVGQKVIFLRKLTAGGSQHSFGIHVASMAGMPRSIVERAAHILAQLEQKSIENGLESPDGVKTQKVDTGQIAAADAYQLSIFETVDPTAGKLKEVIQELDLNRMTPIDCMMKLNELINILQEDN